MGGVSFLLIMISSIVGNYLFALLINQLDVKQKKKSKKVAFIFAIAFNLGLLIYFKYTNFLVGIIESIAKANFGLREVVLPIGISFFTFQAMSYVIDVYLNKIECQKNPLLLALYISLFPQLIAGPIVKYSDIENQLKFRTESVDKFLQGIKRFIYGLAKKVLISNIVGGVAEKIFAFDVSMLSSFDAWAGIICYTIQIYFDFSGYSDMAIGLGKMFGFEFNENFNYPYTSLSVQEFWRRWHISLSSWFKEYVYIPLGGNRKGKVRTYLNLFIVFLLTGIWHGANYTFLLWGIFYGVFLVIERLFLGDLLKKNKFKPLNWLYTMLVVVLLWVFFRAENVGYAFAFIGKMFSFSRGGIELAQIFGMMEIFALLFGIIFCGFAQRSLGKFYEKIKEKSWMFWADFGFQMILFVTCIMFLVNSSFNPFIYFQF